MYIDQIKSATTAELVAFYNKVTGKTIKKFSTRAAGEAQVKKILTERGVVSVKKEPGKRDNYEARIIQILVKENPKRVGSKAYEKFEVLLKMNGKTIRDFKNQEGNYPDLDSEQGWPSTELRWAVRLGLVTIIKQTATALAA